MTLLAKLRACNRADGAALGEAFVLLLLVSAALRWMKFETLGRIASLTVAARVPADQQVIICERCAWAVAVAAKRSPLRALCFERGLAAQIMLRRRGIDATLFYGLRPEADNVALKGHVWVIADKFGITGTEVSAGYRAMVSFPSFREQQATDIGECLQPW